MLSHLVLGLLRDGAARHGYGLIVDLRVRSGRHLASGNLYRELARLSAHGLVTGCANASTADPRRVPYRITDGGREAFDTWLTSPKTLDGELEEWLTFLDRVPPEALGRLLDRQLELLWASGKRLAELREGAAEAGRPPRDAFSAWLSLRTRRTAADVEFLQELHDRVGGREHACPYGRMAERPDAAPVLRLARGGHARRQSSDCRAAGRRVRKRRRIPAERDSH